MHNIPPLWFVREGSCFPFDVNPSVDIAKARNSTFNRSDCRLPKGSPYPSCPTDLDLYILLALFWLDTDSDSPWAVSRVLEFSPLASVALEVNWGSLFLALALEPWPLPLRFSLTTWDQACSETVVLELELALS